MCVTKVPNRKRHCSNNLSMISTLFFISIAAISASYGYSVKQSQGGEIEFYLTSSDEQAKLQKQNDLLEYQSSPVTNDFPTIEIDSSRLYQTVDGFGYSLTGGSAYVINQMRANERDDLLNELFGVADNSIRISYLRISIGASDLNDHVFSYDDVPAGETDPSLAHFSLKEEEIDLIPILQEIVKINPNISIIATPWSAPVWMKTVSSSVGGRLQTQYYQAYADYFVLYVQQMRDLHGLTIGAITPQNEPLNPYNNPSMYMTASEQSEFIQKYLGPAFLKANLTTHIVAYDHNCDEPSYPLQVLADDVKGGANYVHGSAFHLYAGDVSALSTLHEAYPDRAVFLTEQWTSSQGNFGDDLMWGVENVVIGSLQNWAVAAFDWNLANDPSFEPHTDGGCTECKGALTIDAQSQPDGSSTVERNVAYYIIAHASKFVPPGSVRVHSSIASNGSSSLAMTAFRVYSSDVVVLVANTGLDVSAFNVRIDGDRWVSASVSGRSVATFTFHNC
jgi:glucosylceramidase